MTSNLISPRNLAVFVYKHFPLHQERLTRAVALYKSGAVSVLADGAIEVKGSSAALYRLGKDLAGCTCPDKRAPLGVCKHALAAGLFLAASGELQRGARTTLVVFLRGKNEESRAEAKLVRGLRLRTS